MAGESAVLCTHGDVATEMLGVLVPDPKDPARASFRLQKGEVWVVQSTGSRLTIVEHLRRLPSPAAGAGGGCLTTTLTGSCTPPTGSIRLLSESFGCWTGPSTPDAGAVSLHYALDERATFVETITFETPFSPERDPEAPGLERALLHLHIAAGTSYYKAAAPPEVVVEGREPHR